MTKPAGGMVIYPRNYNTDQDDPTRHFVYGVNAQGEECYVAIIPSEQAQQNSRNPSTAQTIPSIAQFAETHRKARMPCAASPDNSPEKPEGVLLFEQIEIDEEKSQSLGKKVVTAKWASVLTEGSDMPAPVIGKGYLEVNFHFKHSDEAKLYQEEWLGLKRRMMQNVIPDGQMLEAQTRMEDLYRNYIANQTVWFVGVVVEHHAIRTLNDITSGGLYQAIMSELEKPAIPGGYRGVTVRARSGDKVSPYQSFSVATQYDYTEKRPKTAKEATDEFFKFNKSKVTTLLNSGATIELMPSMRINCGKRGNDKFSREIQPLGKVQKCYIDKRFQNSPGNFARDLNGYLFSDVAIRLAEINTDRSSIGNLLLSTIHSYSAPQGNMLTMDSTGKSVYQVAFRN